MTNPDGLPGGVAFTLAISAITAAIWFRKKVDADINGEPVQPDRPDFLVQKFHVTTQSVPSTSDEYPYGLKMIIQTNQSISPVKFSIECSGLIGTALAHPAKLGVAMARMNDPAGQSNVFRYQQDSPALTPDNPIEVHLASAERVTCKLVY